MARINIPGTGLWSSIATSLNSMFTELYNLFSGTTVLVKSAADLAVIDSDKVYIIDGIIDMGTTSITVPATGINIEGLNVNVSGLTSSASNYTMFVSEVGGSGDVFMEKITITTSGASSQVYDLIDVDGGHSIEVIGVNYISCTSLGEIDGYRQGLENNTFRLFGQPSLTLSGAWAGGYIARLGLIRVPGSGSYAMFQAGTNFVMQSRFNTNLNVDLTTDNSFIDFDETNFPNPSTLQLQGCLLSRDGAFNSDDALLSPNITANNLSCTWRQNIGLDNTFEGGRVTVSSQTTNTIASVNTYEDVLGTFASSDLQHFAATTAGRLTHLGTSPEEYLVVASGVIDGTANDSISLKVVKVKDSDATESDISSVTVQITNSVGGNDRANFFLRGNVKLLTDDYIRLQIRNNTSGASVTVLADSTMFVEAR